MDLAVEKLLKKLANLAQVPWCEDATLEMTHSLVELEVREWRGPGKTKGQVGSRKTCGRVDHQRRVSQ